VIQSERAGSEKKVEKKIEPFSEGRNGRRVEKELFNMAGTDGAPPTFTADDAFWKKLKDELDPMKKDLTELKKELEPMKKSLDRLEKRTGILTEEKARKVATDLFGSNFSKRLIIKSIYEVVKLISKADDPRLPKDYDHKSLTNAVTKVAGHIRSRLPHFVKSAYRALVEITSDDAFAHDTFSKAKEELRVVKTRLSSAPEDNDYKAICGVMLGAVSKFGTESLVGDENEDQKDKRVKLTTGRFKSKLERLKKGFGPDGNLEECSGPGIMICAALSMMPEGATESEWIENNCEIVDWKQEVECDIRGSVMLVEDHATISCGEIKSSIGGYSDAVKQMELRANLVEFVLQIVFDNRFTHIVKKGHLFVLESDKNGQIQHEKRDSGLSVFLHRID